MDRAALRFGTVGLATYTGVNLTTYAAVYSLLATRTVDPFATLLRPASAALSRWLGLDMTARVEAMEKAWTEEGGFRHGTVVVVTVAVAKVLVPAKLSATALLLPLTNRLYMRWLTR